MDRTTLYRGIAPLEAKGWIAVTQGPGKARFAALTDVGVAAMGSAEHDWSDVQNRIVTALGPAQWAELQSLLATITRIAREEVD